MDGRHMIISWDGKPLIMVDVPIWVSACDVLDAYADIYDFDRDKLTHSYVFDIPFDSLNME